MKLNRSEPKRPPFELRPTHNVQSLQDFEAQLALPESQNWKLSKKKVVILDLDGTNLPFAALNRNAQLQKSLNEFRESGVAVCLVTNKTILNESGKGIHPNAMATLQDLHRNYPNTIDLVLFDSTNSITDLLSTRKDANKKAMLDSCVTAYSADTAFCYISFDDTSLEYAATQHHMPALNIFMQKNGFPRIPRNKAIDADIQRAAALTSALAEASSELSDSVLTAAQIRRRQDGHLSTINRSGSPTRDQGAAAPRTTNYTAGQYSRDRAAQLSSSRSGDSTYGSHRFEHLDATGYRRLPGDSSDVFEDDKALTPISTGIASRSLKDWGIHHFIKLPSFSEAPSTEGKTFRQAMGIVKQYLYANLVLAPFKALFLIFPFDGLDPVTNMISYAAGAKEPEPYVIESFKDVSIKLLIATFLGFPSRAIKDPKTGKPTITLVQIAKNFVGGIDWEKDTPRDKKRLQLAGIPLKALVFLPVKIFLLPFKAILNGLKLLTEFLPWLATSLSYFIYQIPALGASKTWQWKNDVNKAGWGPVGILLLLLSSILAIASVPLFFLHVFCRTVMVAGRTITSPLISLRKAFAVGSELKLPVGSPQAQRRLAIAIGVFCAAVSVFITVVTWAILWPLFVNHAIANMPTLMSMVNGILGSQPVVASLGALQGASTAVGAFLHTVFGGFIAGLSNFVGVQITYTAIVAVTVLPIALAFSALADYLSNRWANWHEGGIFKERAVLAPAPDSSSSDPNLSPSSSPAPVSRLPLTQPTGTAAPIDSSAQTRPWRNSSTQGARLPQGQSTFGVAPAASSNKSRPWHKSTESDSQFTTGQPTVVAPVASPNKPRRALRNSSDRGFQLLDEATELLDDVRVDVRRDIQKLAQEGKLSQEQAAQLAAQTGRQGRRALRGDDSSPNPAAQPRPATPPTTPSGSARPVPKAPKKRG